MTPWRPAEPSVGPSWSSHTTPPPSFLTPFLSLCSLHSFSLRFTGFPLTRFLNPLSFQSRSLAAPHLLLLPPTCNSPQSLKMASSLLLCTYGPLSFSFLSAPTADSLTTKTSISHCSSALQRPSLSDSTLIRPHCLSPKADSIYNKGSCISLKTHIALAALKKNPYKQYFQILPSFLVLPWVPAQVKYFYNIHFFWD